MKAAHLLNQRIVKFFCFRPLTDVLTRKSNAPPGGPQFGSNSPLYGAQRESNARGLPGGGMGGFGIDWYIRVCSGYFVFEAVGSGYKLVPGQEWKKREIFFHNIYLIQ